MEDKNLTKEENNFLNKQVLNVSKLVKKEINEITSNVNNDNEILLLGECTHGTREFYEKRAPQEWLDALAPLGTDADKPFLETAPFLIVIFARVYGVKPDGEKIKHYYVNESVGIATGMLITALHHAGLVSLTHTPSPMKFLNHCLKRPENERPFLILVTGFPSQEAKVPDLKRRNLEEIATFL